MVGDAKVEERDGAVVVRLYGEHDAGTCDSLRALLGRYVRAGRPVVVSIVDVEFMDCACLGVLSASDAIACELQHRRLVLHHGTSYAVRRLLEATAFLDQMLHSRDLDEAVRLAGLPRGRSVRWGS